MKEQVKHLSEDELVLHYYRDTPGGVAQHLAGCPECASEFARLEKVLQVVDESTLPVPALSPDYGRQVWAHVRERLPEKRQSAWPAWLAPQRMALAGALAAIIVVAFIAGRFTKERPPAPIVQQQPTPSEKVRERVVLVAVGRHLEQSQMVLVELINTDAQSDDVDISSEQERARDLLTANRLYRQTAQSVGDKTVSSLLEQLERALMEIANSPAEIDRARLKNIQQQIESQGILFKMRVVGSKVNKERKAAAGAPSQGARKL